jgi:hypothetical protein
MILNSSLEDSDLVRSAFTFDRNGRSRWAGIRTSATSALTVVARHRRGSGGHVLFRPIGLRLLAEIVVEIVNKILELARKAEFLYKSQEPAVQRRLLETVLSNCTFDRGTLCPTYSKPFDLLVRGNETGDWRGVWDDFRNWMRRIA